MRNFVKCVLKVHAPAHVKDLKTEHVIMAGSYGTAAATIHHWIGSVVVAVGYFTAAILGAREHAKIDSQ